MKGKESPNGGLCLNKVNKEGLTTADVIELQRKFGKNEIMAKGKKTLLKRIFHEVSETIFLLLAAAAIIYFLLGEAKDGIIMLFFVFGIVGMDVLQEWKTDRALSTLKKLSQPRIQAVRNGEVTCIESGDLVPGDVILAEEGCRMPADGYVLSVHDFCLDESLLTGESGEVFKVPADTPDYEKSRELALASLEVTRPDYCYAGTMVTQGSAAILVDKTGSETVYGKIGLSITGSEDKLTLLQKQMKSLTGACTGIAVCLFLLVSFITYFNLSDYAFSERIIESFLSGIVLSLSMIPAEFPVILTFFLSMGALRLTKKHALIRRLSAVETLGAVSVICVDKTGTITKNHMAVTEMYNYKCTKACLAGTAGLACDRKPHDPMEAAVFDCCNTLGLDKDVIFQGEFIKGYPFNQVCKTMTHVWKLKGEIIAAAKGSPEWLTGHSRLTGSERLEIEEKTQELFKKGLRVIAVGIMEIPDETRIPAVLNECSFTFLGLLGFEDPPKDSITEDIRRCTEAGIRVVMITGDNGDTAAAIAEQVQFPGDRNPMTGNQLNEISDKDLLSIVQKVNIFSRVVPEQKLRIIKTLMAGGGTAAMTGDGVNDVPALKHADIGIAMGLRGSEVTREAADLILLDDNFSTILDTIEDGRRIYGNIQKAIGYVFTIHIPIALICLFGPLLHILPADLMLLPLHVVLLELIMNPTCAAAIERQPAEENIMKQGPRNPKERLLTKGILIKSGIQGIAIFLSSFGSYYGYLLFHPENADTARTIGLSVLILSNLFLILVNSSEKDTVIRSFGRIRKENGIVLVLSATVILLLLIIYGPLQAALLLKYLSLPHFLYTVIISFLSVFWYEIVKQLKIGSIYGKK